MLEVDMDQDARTLGLPRKEVGNMTCLIGKTEAYNAIVVILKAWTIKNQ
jgi:hypothetical protein